MGEEGRVFFFNFNQRKEGIGGLTIMKKLLWIRVMSENMNYYYINTSLSILLIFKSLMTIVYVSTYENKSLMSIIYVSTYENKGKQIT